MNHHKNNGYYSLRPNVLLFYALTILSALMGATISIVLDRVILPNPHLVTVDMTGLMYRFVKSEATGLASLVQQRAEVQAFSQRLEAVLKDVAHEKQVILVPKEAVIAGGNDLTEEVSARLSLSLAPSISPSEKMDAPQ